jgi:hypothetical protein
MSFVVLSQTVRQARRRRTATTTRMVAPKAHKAEPRRAPRSSWISATKSRVSALHQERCR